MCAQQQPTHSSPLTRGDALFCDQLLEVNVLIFTGLGVAYVRLGLLELQLRGGCREGAGQVRGGCAVGVRKVWSRVRACESQTPFLFLHPPPCIRSPHSLPASPSCTHLLNVSCIPGAIIGPQDVQLPPLEGGVDVLEAQQAVHLVVRQLHSRLECIWAHVGAFGCICAARREWLRLHAGLGCRCFNLSTDRQPMGALIWWPGNSPPASPPSTPGACPPCASHQHPAHPGEQTLQAHACMSF